MAMPFAPDPPDVPVESSVNDWVTLPTVTVTLRFAALVPAANGSAVVSEITSLFAVMKFRPITRVVTVSGDPRDPAFSAPQTATCRHAANIAALKNEIR